MQYDCIWYKPEGRDDALRLVRRVPNAECSRRRLAYGLRFWLDGVKMPLAGFGMCSFVVRNFYGSSHLMPSSDSIFNLVRIEETSPFYITANFVEPIEQNKSIQIAAENEIVAEQQAEKMFQADGGMAAVWMRRGVARYFDAVGVVYGKASATNKEMEDDSKVLLGIIREDEQSLLRNAAHRIKGFFVRDTKEPVQMRFIYKIYPFLLTGEVPGYQPKPETDSAKDVEGYYRKALSSLLKNMNSGRVGE